MDLYAGLLGRNESPYAYCIQKGRLPLAEGRSHSEHARFDRFNCQHLNRSHVLNRRKNCFVSRPLTFIRSGVRRDRKKRERERETERVRIMEDGKYSRARYQIDKEKEREREGRGSRNK